MRRRWPKQIGNEASHQSGSTEGCTQRPRSPNREQQLGAAQAAPARRRHSERLLHGPVIRRHKVGQVERNSAKRGAGGPAAAIGRHHRQPQLLPLKVAGAAAAATLGRRRILQAAARRA